MSLVLVGIGNELSRPAVKHILPQKLEEWNLAKGYVKQQQIKEQTVILNTSHKKSSPLLSFAVALLGKTSLRVKQPSEVTVKGPASLKCSLSVLTFIRIIVCGIFLQIFG